MEKITHCDCKDYPKLATRLYHEKNLEPIPIAPGKKFPTIKSWPDIRLPFEQWPKNHGIGLRTGRLSAIDIDVYFAQVVEDLLSFFDGLEILTRIGQAPKVLVPIICPEVAGKILSDQWSDENGVLHRIEILSYGQQFVAYGIHPDTKSPYQWSGDLLSHSLPVVPMQFIDGLFARFNVLAAGAGWTNITVKVKQVKSTRRRGCRAVTGNKPGDLYNRACSIKDCLEEYGWTHYQGDYWTRPGKKHGISGTIFDNSFWCFTSSTCLEPDRSYDCFGLLAMYECSGDFAAAAKAVREVA